MKRRNVTVGKFVVLISNILALVLVSSLVAAQSGETADCAKAATPVPGTAVAPESVGEIAFEATVDNNTDIYVVNTNGSNLRRLNTGASVDYDPAWSPDGKQIAFVSNRTGNDEIYVMDENGSDLRQVTHNNDNDDEPSWSPDGKRFAYVSDRTGNFDIYTMDTDGAHIQRLTEARDDQRYSDPRWSSDGKQIAYIDQSCGSGLELINADSTDMNYLPPDPSIFGAANFLSWSPIDSEIAFSTFNTIYSIHSDGSGLKRLIDISGQYYGLDWSPDGKYIVFDGDLNERSALYVMDADGSHLRRLISDCMLPISVAWRPGIQNDASLLSLLPAFPRLAGVVIEGQGMNMHSGPKTDFPSDGVLITGTSVTLIGRTDSAGWVKIDMNGIQGWVTVNLIQADGDIDTLPVMDENG